MRLSTSSLALTLLPTFTISEQILPTTTLITTSTAPATLNSDLWKPISTVIPSPSPSPSPDFAHDLLKFLHIRQGAVVTAAPAATTAETQQSPITTIGEELRVNGVMTQVQVVYTQLFSAVPDQWSSATPGSIGLGTITGKIGKRDVVPTQVPVIAEAVDGVKEVEVVEEEAVTEVKKETSTLENKTGKVKANAGSALALILAIAAMIVV